MPIFPDTRDGRAARLAYYEARKLNNPPNSLLDYNDAKRGLEPPAEREGFQNRGSCGDAVVFVADSAESVAALDVGAGRCMGRVG